ncbi:MAG TPA: 6-phosphogluconolactonase [Methylomirabilota bacterium]|jgi:6-phosphogluconolactonase|nr:6-phosphogluconolactonase [Methylomirabilota bacterium]
MRDVRLSADAEALGRAAAREFIEIGREAIAARGRFVAALAGGATPRRIYELLAEPERHDQIDWTRVEFFWGDERAVPPDHPDSNYGMAAAALLAELDLQPEQIHRIQAERPDRERAARDYQIEIARVFGVSPDGPPPVFDLILLGMGADGHTASLFPYTDALREQHRHVVSHYVAKLQADRITLTFPIINRAGEIRVVAAGAEKAPTLKEVLEGPPDPERLPSQLLDPVAGRLAWLVDRAAASQLALEECR